VYVWKKKGDGLTDREVNGTVKFGGGSLMVWGCMGWNGVGMLAEVEGKMNAEQYVDILNDHLLPSLAESGIDEEDIIFQQDNDPVKVVLKGYRIQRALASACMLCPFPEYSPVFQNTMHIVSEGPDDYCMISGYRDK